MTLADRQSRNSLLLFLGALLATTVIYWPGLYGSFAFDDSVFLVANDAIRVNSLELTDWIAAAMSFPAGSHQGRWLGMLSFALNNYFGGMDPFWFKATNLAIHLLNGFLLFLALRALFDLLKACRTDSANPRIFNSGLAAASIAALWLVLPINLTGVLYISQRLESLSNTFVFLGLWWYLRARIALWNSRSGPQGMWAALVVCTTIGLLVKESAILLPLYTAVVEFVLTGLRDRDRRWCRSVLKLYGSLLLVPLFVGLVWLAGWIGGPRSYGRAFDIPERLMTESRVLVEYIHWTLAPNLDSLTLFHDDIEISRGLLTPPTTLASILLLTSMLGLAFWQRARRPLLSLGIFWYFAGHLLTATIIPLMLVFEHRNYFPSVGLLLAAGSLFAMEVLHLRARILIPGFACVFAFYAFTTTLRAQEWSSPLQLTASDAAKRPDSSAAQYEYARTLLASTLNGDPEPMRIRAFAVLERMASNPEADAVHNQLLIVTSAKLGLPIKPAWWDSLIAKLRSHSPTSVDASAMSGLLRCYDQDICPKDVPRLRDAFAAAANHPGGYAQLLSAHGQFAMDYLKDRELAEKQYRAAISQSPTDPMARANLVVFLARVGRIRDAELEMAPLRVMNKFGVLDEKLSELEMMLLQAQIDKNSRRALQPENALDVEPENLL